MDSIAIVAIGLIALVPSTFVAARIWQDPFAGLCLWVVLLPVSKSIASLAGYVPDEGPEVLRKLTLGDPVLLMTALALLFNEKGPVGTLGTQGRRVLLLLGVFCVVGIASAISGRASPESFVELATYFWLCVSVVVICRLLGARRRAERILVAFRWAAVLACVAGTAGTVLLLRQGSDNLLVRGGRVTGLFEAPKQVESFMISVIPFLCVTALSAKTPRRARFLYGALVVVAALSVLVSGSRLGVVLVCAAILSTLAVASPRAAVVSACLFLLTAGSAWRWFEAHRGDVPFAVQRALSFLENDRFDLEAMSRGRANQLETWYTVFGAHPILGVGLDQFRNQVPLVVAGGKAQEMHNSYLAVLAEEGLAGGLVMFTLLGTVLARSLGFLHGALRNRTPEELENARALLISYVCLLLYGMNQYGLRQRYFWFVVALIISLPRVYAIDRTSRVRPSELTAVATPRLAPNWIPQRS